MSRDDKLWNEVNDLLGSRPGWSVQESPTPGVGPYWAFMSQGRVDRSVFIDGGAAHLYEEDTDREVRFETAEELVTWLDADRTIGPSTPTPKPSDPLHWS